MSDMWGPGLTLIFAVFVMIGIPCIGVTILGLRMIDKLGNYPSKTPAIQMSIFVKLVIIEFFSVALILLFYHAMTEYDRTENLQKGFKRYNNTYAQLMCNTDNRAEQGVHT